MRAKKPKIEPGWLEALKSEFSAPYMADLREFLVAEKSRHPVYPPGGEIFAAFWSAPFNSVKVVIIGQDPYHGPGQAHGLCFSVNKGVPIPPSLQNIFKERLNDVQVPLSDHGDLRSWASQGILLLNTVLTVRHRQPNSHKNKGWEQFTDAAISALNRERKGLVFVLWGKHAQTKKNMVDKSKHHIIESTHPSPFSAHRGFFGSRPFSKINEYLKIEGEDPIDWRN